MEGITNALVNIGSWTRAIYADHPVAVKVGAVILAIVVLHFI